MKASVILALLTCSLRSTAPDGHYRGGKKLSGDATEVDLSTLSEAQLDAINDDKQVIRPDDWADLYAAAKKRLGVKPKADLAAELLAANAEIAELKKQLADAQEKKAK